MKMLKSNDDTPDRLSALPDVLIHEVFSFLDLRDVVKTTLLSNRWKDLWTTTPCIQFTESHSDPVRLRNFVNRALMLWRGTYLRKFEMTDYGNSDLDDDDVNLWILFAKERKVEELIICSSAAPQCIYECSSLRKLKILDCYLETDRNVQWGVLNSLELSNCLLSEDWINQVFSSSPQLETFKSYNDDSNEVENMSIQSSSLKKFSIDAFHYESSVLTISAPNLEALEFYGEPYSKYLLTNVLSLTKVYLGFVSNSFSAALVEEALSQIFPAIQHVGTVTLSADCFKMLGVMKDKYSVSPSSNVELLKIESGVTELSDLLVLLENFPNLKMLIIVWKLGYKDFGKPFNFIDENYISQANILKSNLLQLRTVKITWDLYHVSIFQFMEFLLKRAPVLEKMVIQMRGFVVSKHMILAAQKVGSLQRSFPSVELVFC